MIEPNKHNNTTFSFVLLVILLVIGTIMSLQLSKEKASAGFTKEEAKILSSKDSVMYVLNYSDSADLKVLRAKSTDLDSAALLSDAFRSLSAKLLATVRAPEYGGVGIAAPQIGISRRVIAVQREDKPGEPFEVYADIRIDSLLGTQVRGSEGCLSVPTLRGQVMRYPIVKISYRNPSDFTLRQETVEGFTAIIFQHECDHLDGVLYIDKADSISVDEAWKAEYDAFAAQGKYRKSR